MDPDLFAMNVRKEIAHELGAKLSGHWYEDAKLYTEAIKFKEKRIKPVLKNLLHIPGKEDRVELKDFQVRDFRQVYKDNSSHLPELVFLVRKFIELDENGAGEISYTQFCKTLGLPEDSPQTKNLFFFFDRNSSNTIDFRELALGLAYCSTSVDNVEKKKLAFLLYDIDGDGFISKSELGLLLKAGLPAAQDTAGMDVQDMLKEAPEKMDQQEFIDFVTAYPSIVNYALFNNNTGWKFNIQANIE